MINSELEVEKSSQKRERTEEKNLVINQWEKLAALSNRRLSVQNLVLFDFLMCFLYNKSILNCGKLNKKSRATNTTSSQTDYKTTNLFFCNSVIKVYHEFKALSKG